MSRLPESAFRAHCQGGENATLYKMSHCDQGVVYDYQGCSEEDTTTCQWTSEWSIEGSACRQLAREPARELAREQEQEHYTLACVDGSLTYVLAPASPRTRPTSHLQSTNFHLCCPLSIVEKNDGLLGRAVQVRLSTIGATAE